MASKFLSSKHTVLKLKLFFKVYGPFVGAGIRLTRATPDFKSLETRMKLRWYNTNLVGTHYGGSLYSMTDPFYMLMLLANIGDEHFVWDKAAAIEFVSPVKTEVRAEFKLTDEVIERIVEEAKDGERHFVDFEVNIVDTEDALVAKVHKTLYVRRKPKNR